MSMKVIEKITATICLIKALTKKMAKAMETSTFQESYSMIQKDAHEQMNYIWKKE